MFKHTSILAVIVATGLLAMAGPGQAIYIETPLTLRSPTDHADVGDDVEYTIQPNANNESAEGDWAGKQVKVRYSYDKNEGQAGGPDDSVSNEGHTEGDITTITLDGKASGSFTWKVPAEVDDHNVGIFLEDDAGERLAFTHLAIGDAEPMMHAMSGPSDGQPEIAPEHRDLKDQDAASEEAAGLGVLALVGAIGAAALAVSLRRRD